MNVETALLRTPDVLSMLNVSRATLWRMVADGRFPAPVKLGPQLRAWRRADVEAWVSAL